MATKLRTPFKYKLCGWICKAFGFNLVIYDDHSFTKYSRRIEVHK